MKKLIAGLLLLPFFSFVVADWVAVKLDEKVTVDFPTQPEKKVLGGNDAWVQDIDKDGRCMAMVLDFGNFGMDSASLAVEMEKGDALTNFRIGVMDEIKGSKLISERKIKVKGNTCFDYIIDMGKGDQPDAFNMMHTRSIFVGSKMYTLSFFEKNNIPREKERNTFFSSFKVNK